MSKPIYVVGDAETYYCRQTYSLKKMMTQQYLEDPRFEEIMWTLKTVNEGIPYWGIGKADCVFDRYNWDDVAFIAHNANFDGGIVHQHHGIKPYRTICTIGMARTLGVQKITGSLALASLARFFKLPMDKGNEVVMASGKHMVDFTIKELSAYRKYNIKDTLLLESIFNIMLPFLNDEELLWNSTVTKMYTEPTLSLDRDRLHVELESIKARRLAQQQSLMDELSLDSIEQVKKYMGSDVKFAALLEAEDVELPMKVSPTTGKEIYAFAKTDHKFNQLLSHTNQRVRMLAETRIGVKSNTEQTRIERLIALSELPSDNFRIPHNISAAHTHRLGGTDSINIQNFSSGRVKGQSKTARQSIVMKDEKGNIKQGVIAAPDSGQIEARILAFIADDQEMLNVFATGQCPYSIMAESVYKTDRKVIKAGDGAYKGGDDSKKQMYLYRQTGKAAVLQLGFGAGAAGFHRSLRDMYGVTTVDKDEAKLIHTTYKNDRCEVVSLWGKCKEVLENLVDGGSGYFGGPDGKLFYYTAKHDIFGYTVPGIRLPNGTWLTYPKLHKRKAYNEDGSERKWDEFAYYKDLHKYRNAVIKAKNGSYAIEQDRIEAIRQVGYKHGTRIWYGTLVENLCQSLAFAVLKWQGVRIAKATNNCFNVHDEFCIASDNIVEDAEKAKAIMETTPPWLPGLKLECEYEIADNYGDT